MKNSHIKITMPAEIILDRRISSTEKILFSLIKSHRGSPIPVSFEYLGEWMGLTTAQIGKSCNHLVDMGYLIRKKKGPKQYVYSVPKVIKQTF
jgi:predicted transcriptional regulator